jgi:DNA-binding XRE family transcriptional regulator
MFESQGLPGLPSARRARHMSRAAVAQALGLPERVLEQWESGKKATPILFAMAVARVVGTSVDKLRQPSEEPPEPLREPLPPVPGIEVLFSGFFPGRVSAGSEQLDLERFYNRY